MASSKKSRKAVYLIDKYEDDIKGLKLPSIRQALAYFLYRHVEMKETTRTASTKVIEKIEESWNRARIPVHHKQDSIKKLENIFARWQALKKNSSRLSATQIKNEWQFKDCFDDLFDIAHGNALVLLTIEEDKLFLLAQREKGRRGAMCSVDTVLTKRECNKQKLLVKQNERRQKATTEAQHFEEKIVLESSTSGDEESEDDLALDKSILIPSQLQETTPKCNKQNKQIVISPGLTATLDRNKVSDRQAMMVVAETARTLGHDVGPLVLSRSTIRRERQKHRTLGAAQILENFNPDMALIVHWDGKLLPDISSKIKIDRLPVLVSSLDGRDSQLLAVPKISAGTGKAEADAVFQTLNDWNLCAKVQGMCFDTTSSNTGQIKGACILLEKLLKRHLLHIACRHHILELIAGAAFTASLSTSSAPEILLFKRFQAQWQYIDQTRYEDYSTDHIAINDIADIKEETVSFLSEALIEVQPRDDYRELIELALIFLGTPPSRGIHFAAPGAMHQARWMSKTIYTFKVWMFRSQFKLTAYEEKGLRNLCIFFARIYVKAWTTAPLAVRAPQDDLHLLQSLVAYNAINKAISKATSQKMAGHMWYLSEELVGLSFFDDNVTDDIKDNMVKAMSEIEGKMISENRINVPLSASYLQNKSVANFTSKNTINLFNMLSLPQDFLQLPASQWKENEEYKKARTAVTKLSVINDHAERGVALVQDFTGRLTKNEDQLQCLLQIVADHRKHYPQALKHAFVE